VEKSKYEVMNAVDSDWTSFKDASFVKGRHCTELDQQALNYIIDIARPG